MRLKDKVCVITGAAAGIGKAVAEKFSEEAAVVVMVDIDSPTVTAIADKMKKSGAQVMAVGADVSVYIEVERLFKKVIVEYGRIDVLVNNAGIRKDNLINKISQLEWQAIIDSNLTGCFNCSKVAQKYMSGRSYGKIINIAGSFPPVLADNGSAGYCAANAGIEGLTRSLAMELGRYNITVNCVAPDFIDTSMTRYAARKAGMYLDDFREFSIVQVPLGRLGTPGDVADVILFFAVDDSRFVTGQVLNVRGGP